MVKSGCHAGCGRGFPCRGVKTGAVLRILPLEAVKTNTLGAENVMRAAGEVGVGHVIVLSTDKAVYPINAMGMSKAL